MSLLFECFLWTLVFLCSICNPSAAIAPAPCNVTEQCKVCYSTFKKLTIGNFTVQTTHAICRHSALTDVPSQLSKNLGRLDMRESSKLEILRNTSFDKYIYLQELTLYNSDIKDIENGAFRRLKYLTELELGHNKLTVLRAEMFIGLDSLKNLDLRENDLRRLPPGVFRHLFSLQDLFLHDNVGLGRNITDGAFQGLDLLKTLHLGKCGFRRLDHGIFQSLMSLKLLDVSFNEIETVAADTFTCSPSLTKLHLNNNTLNRIPVKALTNVGQLQELDISGNPVKYIEATAFAKNTKLRTLYLNKSVIQLIENGAFKDLKNLRKLYLQENPLKCDCKIRWLLTWLLGRRSIVPKDAKIRCSLPSRYAGKELLRLNTSELKCSCDRCREYASCDKEVSCSCDKNSELDSCDKICVSSNSSTKSCIHVDGQCYCCNVTHSPVPKIPKCTFTVTNRTCHENGEYVKVNRTLECFCKDGFYGDGENKCQDENECQMSSHNCNAKIAECINIKGGFRCQCKPGFKEKYPKTKPSGRLCEDINECVKEPGICGAHAQCYNTKVRMTDGCEPDLLLHEIAKTHKPGKKTTLTTKDNGTYICSCDQHYNKVKNRCYPTITQEDIEFSIHQWNSSTLLIRWSIKNLRNLTILSYQIIYLDMGHQEGNDFQEGNSYPGNATQGYITNLMPDSSIFVRIKVTPIHGIPIVSQTFSASTKGKEKTNIQESQKNGLTGAIVGSVIGVVVLVGVIIVLVLCYGKRRKKSRQQEQNVFLQPSVMEDIIELRLQGNGAIATGAVAGAQKEVHNNPDPSLLALSSGAERVDVWEISRERVVLGETIGEGQFGIVYAGTVYMPEGPMKVAIKCIKDVADRYEIKDLKVEMEMMKEIGQHPNIVSLIGTCTMETPLYIITEYVAGGNLLDVLRESRKTDDEYVNVVSTLTSRDLLRIALDVSRGMRHIAMKKFVHRDLAARNVLMTEGMEAKVADFGLARDIYCEGKYVKTGGGRLPIKWMAPEAIRDQVYTTQTDVWSFGVLLWEIVTLGHSPYPGIPIAMLLEKLLYGYRMPRPNHCSDEVYSLMESCWNVDPVARPGFDELCTSLACMLSEEGRTYVNMQNYCWIDWEDSRESSADLDI